MRENCIMAKGAVAVFVALVVYVNMTPGETRAIFAGGAEERVLPSDRNTKHLKATWEVSMAGSEDELRDALSTPLDKTQILRFYDEGGGAAGGYSLISSASISLPDGSLHVSIPEPEPGQPNAVVVAVVPIAVCTAAKVLDAESVFVQKHAQCVGSFRVRALGPSITPVRFRGSLHAAHTLPSNVSVQLWCRLAQLPLTDAGQYHLEVSHLYDGCEWDTWTVEARSRATLLNSVVLTQALIVSAPRPPHALPPCTKADRLGRWVSRQFLEAATSPAHIAHLMFDNGAGGYTVPCSRPFTAWRKDPITWMPYFCAWVRFTEQAMHSCLQQHAAPSAPLFLGDSHMRIIANAIANDFGHDMSATSDRGFREIPKGVVQAQLCSDGEGDKDFCLDYDVCAPPHTDSQFQHIDALAAERGLIFLNLGNWEAASSQIQFTTYSSFRRIIRRYAKLLQKWTERGATVAFISGAAYCCRKGVFGKTWTMEKTMKIYEIMMDEVRKHAPAVVMVDMWQLGNGIEENNIHDACNHWNGAQYELLVNLLLNALCGVGT